VSRIARFLVTLTWAALFAVWTVGLLTPDPLPDVQASLGPEQSFIAGKLLHVSAYAVLTIWAVFLPLPARWRVAAVLLLSFHAFATEYLQQFVGRGSSWADVGRDHVGIAVGLAVTLRQWWQRRGGGSS
jgi:VanZ family protein